MDEERWQESLNARNTLAANQAIYAAWSAAWTAEATDNIINIYKHFTLRGQRCPYTLQIVEAFSRHCAVNAADVAIYTWAQLTGCNAKPSGSTCRLQRTSARPWASHAGWQRRLCSLGLFIGVTSVASGGNRHSLNTRARDYLTGRLVCGGRLRGRAGGPVTYLE